MPDPIIGTAVGLLTSEAVKQAANHLDRTDEDIQRHLANGNLEEALRLAQEDPGSLELIVRSLRRELETRTDDPAEVNQAIEEVRAHAG